MRDLEPERYFLLEKIRSTFYEVSRTFGFQLMEPSPIEQLETLEAKSGPAIRDDIYYFKDKAGREIGLRFDLTVGLTRYVCSKRGVQLPVKLATFSDMWRYDEPQYGRYRWFYQWDVEIFGSSSVHADAEVIEFTSVLFQRLGLKDVLIEVGDRTLVEEFVRKELGVENELVILELLRALDKVGKKPLQDIVKEYREKGVSREYLSRLVDFGKIKGASEHVFEALRELNLSAFESLSKLVDALKSRSLTNVELNMGIVRGLYYYTGIVFETYDQEDMDLGALCGGGRYDSLPGIFGRPDMRATGVAGGVERAMIALSKRKAKTETEKPLVFVAYAIPKLLGEAAEVASTLRKNGIPTDFDFASRNLKKQLELASSKQATYALIVAPEEYSQDQLILRDMGSGSQTLVPKQGLARAISSRLA